MTAERQGWRARLESWRAKVESAKPLRWWRERPGPVRFLVRAALLMAVFYSALYYPYGESSLPARLLYRYLALLARVSGGFVSLFDAGASVDGLFILGRQPLQIVLDCAALDALALFAAAVLAFPAPARAKLIGFVTGGAIIWMFNVMRIVLLYVAGARSPRLFDILHEDVMALLLVLVSVGCFAVWAALSRTGPRKPTTDVPSTV